MVRADCADGNQLKEDNKKIPLPLYLRLYSSKGKQMFRLRWVMIEGQ